MKLNTLCGHLVPLLDLPMSEFTELLRALKEGSPKLDLDGEKDVLKGKPGPGGGVEADPFHTAFLLIGILVDGPRKDAALSTSRAWNHLAEGVLVKDQNGIPTHHEVTCPLTGRAAFGHAFKAILEQASLADRVGEVRVFSDGRAEIAFDGNQVSRFKHHPAPGSTPGLYRGGLLRGPALRSIARLITEGE